jgi:hypothetical protein
MLAKKKAVETCDIIMSTSRYMLSYRIASTKPHPKTETWNNRGDLVHRGSNGPAQASGETSQLGRS